ncbi:AGAP009109-PA, partial [Anopheles gambiae str. PEST]
MFSSTRSSRLTAPRRCVMPQDDSLCERSLSNRTIGVSVARASYP